MESFFATPGAGARSSPARAAPEKRRTPTYSSTWRCGTTGNGVIRRRGTSARPTTRSKPPHSEWPRQLDLSSTKSGGTQLGAGHALGEAPGAALPEKDGWPPFLVIVAVGYCIDLYSDFARQGKSYLQFPDPSSYHIRDTFEIAAKCQDGGLEASALCSEGRFSLPQA